MKEVLDGYIFTTFQDGSVIFFRDSYERHCTYHSAICGEEGRDNIQEALIYPHLISSYPLRGAAGKVIANCKKYRTITRERVRTKRGNEWEYWEVVIRKNIGKRKKIVTAHLTSSPAPFVVNDKIEKIVFKRKVK